MDSTQQQLFACLIRWNGMPKPFHPKLQHTSTMHRPYQSQLALSGFNAAFSSPTWAISHCINSFVAHDVWTQGLPKTMRLNSDLPSISSSSRTLGFTGSLRPWPHGLINLKFPRSVTFVHTEHVEPAPASRAVDCQAISGTMSKRSPWAVCKTCLHYTHSCFNYRLWRGCATRKFPEANVQKCPAHPSPKTP